MSWNTGDLFCKNAAIGLSSQIVTIVSFRSILIKSAIAPRPYGRSGFHQHTDGVSRILVHLTASLCSSGFRPAGAGAASSIAEQYRAMARTAERGLLDAVWLGRDAQWPLDALPLLGSLIVVTERIGLGGLWRIARAEPFHVARVFATLDHLAGGRTALIVGLPGEGPDDDQFAHAPALTPDDALERAGELIDVARQLWDSWEDEGWLLDVATGRFADPDHVHPIEHAGRFFAVRGPLNPPRPPQGNPAVVFEVGIDPPALALAEADVLLLSCRSQEQAASLRRRASPAQRILVNVMPILGITALEAQRRADALGRIPFEAMRFVGTPEQAVDLFAARVQNGACDGFNLMAAGLPEDLEQIVDVMIPIGRARGVFRESYEGVTLREHLLLPRPRSRFSA